jgi:hypothetical protein
LDTSSDKDNDTREYTKSGGDAALKKDFNKFPGDAVQSGDGKVQIKTLPDGIKIVIRPTSTSTTTPTLEIQPPKVGDIDSQLRVKIRYP